MGVNDLLEQFTRWARSSEAVRHGARCCRAELREVAVNAWHPVSEPPTEADGDEEGFVAIWDGRKVDFQFWNTPKEYWGCRYWARINDVVLLPTTEAT